MSEKIHGFKVFRSDWSCRPSDGFKQYSCPGRFQQDGVLDMCGNGIHFCLNLADCFDYYPFDPDKNKVAEVIAHGEVLHGDHECCTNDLEVVREISWQEVLMQVNTGNRNTGNRNTGNCNTGDRNTGNWNTGNCNTGNCNTGNRNTGNWNTGNWNAGNRNTGDRNTGNRNTGDRNTGDWNTGDWNTGDWNVSSFNVGCFMTKEQPIMMFDQLSDWTLADWHNSDAYHLLSCIPKDITIWVHAHEMTDQEKAEHPEHQATGGYLKTLDESDAAQIWWNGLNQTKRDIILALPNFDADIFLRCTGINVRRKDG